MRGNSDQYPLWPQVFMRSCNTCLYTDDDSSALNYLESYPMVSDKADTNGTVEYDRDRKYEEFYRLFKKKDFESAFSVCSELAEQGDAVCQRWAGRMYHKGLGTGRDETKARYWLGLAAKQGDGFAQWYLGRLYHWNKDSEEAIRWYRISAEQGYGPAIYTLATCYYHGSGVRKDENKAIELLDQAMAKGDLKAQLMYGRHLALGRKGIKGIFRGVSLILNAVITGVKIAWINPGDERIVNLW